MEWEKLKFLRFILAAVHQQFGYELYAKHTPDDKIGLDFRCAHTICNLQFQLQRIGFFSIYFILK